MSDMGHDFLGEPVESTQLAARINGVHLDPRCRVCRNDLVRKQVFCAMETCPDCGDQAIACGCNFPVIPVSVNHAKYP